jgi:hypothetical protein
MFVVGELLFVVIPLIAGLYVLYGLICGLRRMLFDSPDRPLGKLDFGLSRGWLRALHVIGGLSVVSVVAFYILLFYALRNFTL